MTTSVTHVHQLPHPLPPAAGLGLAVHHCQFCVVECNTSCASRNRPRSRKYENPIWFVAVFLFLSPKLYQRCATGFEPSCPDCCLLASCMRQWGSGIGGSAVPRFIGVYLCHGWEVHVAPVVYFCCGGYNLCPCTTCCAEQHSQHCAEFWPVEAASVGNCSAEVPKGS